MAEERIRFEYSPFLREYSFIVSGRTMLCCDQFFVDALMREGCYDSSMECFKDYVAQTILELILKNDCFSVRAMIEYIFLHKFDNLT